MTELEIIAACRVRQLELDDLELVIGSGRMEHDTFSVSFRSCSGPDRFYYRRFYDDDTPEELAMFLGKLR